MSFESQQLIADNVPWAGLGNRLRFTLSARAVADSERRQFSYSWPVGDAFGAALTDLWEFHEIEVPRGAQAPLTEKDDLTALRDQPVWHIQSAGVVRGDGSERSWETDLADLQLSPDLAQRVTDFRAENLPLNYVGVQIRVSEKTHAKTLEASPVEWFVTRMKQMVAADPDTRFFVSCDVPEAQEHLLGLFPTAAALHDKGRYNSREAISASVVDLEILAGSTHLLGPYWSSFVHTAWLMGGKAQALENSQSTRSSVR